MSSEFDLSILHQAARLAVMGHGTAEPNPMVGCIITNSDGDIVGEGFHEKYGEAHAEINALAMAGDDAQGSTAYITLEPCNHQGKTPPCSEALLKAGVARVVIGVRDPHEDASGGIDFLRRNSIEVEIAHDEICDELIAPFAYKIKTGLPWVTCKWAQTKDGCIETPRNESNWISCEESQQLVHEERGCVDAIVVGVGTVVADNPTLTVRGAIKHRTPIRVVIDPTLRTPLESNILNEDAPTLLVHAEGAETSAFSDYELLSLPRTNGVLDLALLFRHLVTKYDATNIMVEGGTTLFQHIFNQNLANELWVFTAQHRSNMTPKINMNSLLTTLSTTRIEEEPSGVDTVERYLVNHCK